MKDAIKEKVTAKINNIEAKTSSIFDELEVIEASEVEVGSKFFMFRFDS